MQPEKAIAYKLMGPKPSKAFKVQSFTAKKIVFYIIFRFSFWTVHSKTNRVT